MLIIRHFNRIKRFAFARSRMRHSFFKIFQMKTCLSIAFLLLACTLSAQTVWQQVVPTGKTQQARDIAPAADGTYWVLTNYRQGSKDSSQVNLLHVNLQGEITGTTKSDEEPDEIRTGGSDAPEYSVQAQRSTGNARYTDPA